MIIYNLRYRGPYEYDKLVLNVLQYHNTIHEIYEALHKEDEENLAKAQKRIDELNDRLYELCGKLVTYEEESKDS